MKNEQTINSVDNKNELYMDEQGNPVQTQYVDEFGNPIDPSLIDASGNYIGASTQYVDEQGNPIDPSLVDSAGNYIGASTQYVDEQGNPVPNDVLMENGIINPNVQNQSAIDQNKLANDLTNVANSGLDEAYMVTGAETAPITSQQIQIEGKELLTGMVTFDYNNVPITDIVNSIILDAINKGASDIHFDPFAEGIKIRVRIDGELNDYSIVPLYVKKNMITRIKIISGMNITESRTPQDGAIRTELQNKTVDLRVSCLPTNLGEKIVIRIMDYSMSSAGLEVLDFNKENLDKVNKMLALPNGIILVTGATGTGKSTTVYAMLQKLNTEGTNLVTVEDPIEMSIGGINQVQAAPEIGLNFATVLRSILRQDPDVIMIGEIRDDETARIAVRASITGHLVLSTIHTNNSLNTIERLTDMSVERYLLGSSLEGIVSQKLSRRLCEKCKKLRPTTEYEKEIFKKALDKDVNEIYEPVGCPECSKGYRGRIAIHEVLLLNQTIKDAITNGSPKEFLRNLVYGEGGTQTMLQDGLEKVLEGKTSFEEILKLIDLEDDLGTGTQLGLQEQMNASNMNFAQSMPQFTNMASFNQNVMPMYVPYPMPMPEDDGDEEVVIKPVRKKKKKHTVVEIDADELKSMLENDETPTNPIEKEPVQEEIEKFEDDEPFEELSSTEEVLPSETIPEVLLDTLDETDDVVETNEVTEEKVENNVGEVPATLDAEKDLRTLLDQIHNSLDKLHDTKKIIGKKKFNIKVQEILNDIEPIYKDLTELDANFRFDNKTEDDIKDLLKGIALNIKLLKNDTEITLYKNTIKRINDVLGIMAEDIDLETDSLLSSAEDLKQIEKKEKAAKKQAQQKEIKEETNDEIFVELEEDDQEVNLDVLDSTNKDTDFMDIFDDIDQMVEITPEELNTNNDISIQVMEVEKNEDESFEDTLKMMEEEFSDSPSINLTEDDLSILDEDIEEDKNILEFNDNDLLNDTAIDDSVIESILNNVDTIEED